MNHRTPFRTAFTANMQRLGLPVAPEPFEHFNLAVSNASQMAAVVALLDHYAPVIELVRRTIGLERLMVAADYDARLYTVGVVSSIALASGQVDGKGSTTGQLFRFTYQYQLQFPGWQALFSQNAALMDASITDARRVGQRARLAIDRRASAEA
ncbi:hypothetical protein [Marinobacter sp.]|uniref:hypothetical protein n=1 Tax=Marinobacter sp. TaxID=50741 RepID=UPI003569906C